MRLSDRSPLLPVKACAGLSRELWPLIRDDFLGGVGIPRQLPAIGAVVVVELARHANDRRLIRTDVLPTVIDPGGNDDQPLVSLPQHKLIDAAEGGRPAPTVIADDAKRAGRRKQAVDGQMVNSPRPDSTGKCGGQIYLNNRSFREPPVCSKDFRQMAMMMRHRARWPIPRAVDWIEPQCSRGRHQRLPGRS